MKYNFDEQVSRKGTQAMKLLSLPEGCPPDAIPVWVADMDFRCAEPIVQALHDRIDKLIYGYTMYDTPELKEAVTGWFARRYGWHVDPEHVVFSPGVVPAIGYLIEALTNPGDKIVIQRPVYYPFTAKIEGSGRTVVNNALIYQNGTYTIDFADLDAKLADPAVKGMVFCSPHNPVGRVWTQAELTQLVDIAKKHNKWIIADEIHMDLTRHGVTHTPLLKLAPEYAENIVSTTAPSKSFNLAGLQLSNIVIPSESKRKAFKEVCMKSGGSMSNAFGVVACMAAYNQGEDWLDQVRTYLDQNIAFVEEYLGKHLPKAHVVPCEGTYLVWIDLTAYESDPQKLAHLMQQEAKIAFDEGCIFGEEGNGFERLNVACPRSTVEEVLKRMVAVLEK